MRTTATLLMTIATAGAMWIYAKYLYNSSTNVLYVALLLGAIGLIFNILYALCRCAEKPKKVVQNTYTEPINPTEQRIRDNQSIVNRSFYNQDEEDC